MVLALHPQEAPFRVVLVVVVPVRRQATLPQLEGMVRQISAVVAPLEADLTPFQVLFKGMEVLEVLVL